MIKLNGALTVRTIHGRNGPFNVGRLNTSIGDFVIKDSQLDQFDEGVFNGSFSVLEIRPASYFANGRLVVEVRARVSDMSFENELLGNVPEEMPDMDPLEEEPVSDKSRCNANRPSEKSSDGDKSTPPQFGYKEEHALPSTHDQQSASDDEVLFEMFWPLGDQVRLDSTVDRVVLRKQCARLKELGYTFSSKSQIWEISDPVQLAIQ